MIFALVAALIGGLVLLTVFSEQFVVGAARIAKALRMSAIVIGAVVIGFGTSLPELLVSVVAAVGGAPDIALGNVVGSNIANVLLVLGAAAAFGGGLVVAQKIVRIDVPLMIAASVVVFLMSLDNLLGRIEGAVLFSGIVVYVGWTVRTARSTTPEVSAEYEEEFGDVGPASPWVDVALLLGGMAALVVGSAWLVDSSVSIAADLGVSDLVIGLTVVALGTSAPELATSLIAARRGERDIAVGNAVGSNLFNLLSVLGLTALVAPDGVAVSEDALRLDMPIMIAVAVACLPVFFSGYALKRWEGSLFLAYYLAYLAFLVLDQTGSGLRNPFAVVMAVFVIPLTVITLVVIGWQAWRNPSQPPEEIGVG